MAATTNNRLHAASHGGATATTAIINGTDPGGLMVASIQAGYDNIITAPSDGYTFPMSDRFTEFVRGSVTSQDWTELILMYLGTIGTYVFYEKESGTQTAPDETTATYTLHTLLAPVIHTASLNLAHRGRGTFSFGFECKAADTDDGIAEEWVILAAQAKPAAATAYAPALEITAAVHTVPFYHVLGLTLNWSGQLTRFSGDGDTGYTAVDTIWGGVPITGTITVQDSVTMLTILANAEADLVLTVKQAQGAAAKTLTIKNVVFTNVSSDSSADGSYTAYALDFYSNSDATTPLEMATAVLIV